MNEWDMRKELPPGICADQATQLIVDCDAAIMSGVDKSGRHQAISVCEECGVQFASDKFRACPICSVHNAEQIDLQNAGGIRRSADITEQRRLLKKSNDQEWREAKYRRWFIATWVIIIGFAIYWIIK